MSQEPASVDLENHLLRRLQNVTAPPIESLVLKTNSSGEVKGLSPQALKLLGPEALGRNCNGVMKGISPSGRTICKEGCAAALASGALASAPPQEALVRGKLVQLRCFRVGEETVVIADPLVPVEATEKLTKREREVLAMVAQGLSTPAIAALLKITNATVKTHIEHARGRLGARTRAEAVALALRSRQLPSTAT